MNLATTIKLIAALSDFFYSRIQQSKFGFSLVSILT